MNERRNAIFEISRKSLLDYILAETDFRERYPDADQIAVHYDFDSDCFWFKFRHPSLEPVPDGSPRPRISLPKFLKEGARS